MQKAKCVNTTIRTQKAKCSDSSHFTFHVSLLAPLICRALSTMVQCRPMNERIIPYICAYWRVWLVCLVFMLSSCQIAQTPRPAATSTIAAPTATPVPSAGELLDRALVAHTVGDYDASSRDLSLILSSYASAPEARAARYYLAETYAQRGRWTSAVESFKTFLADGAADDLHARALFWLARGYEQAGDWTNAAATYEQYRALKTPLEPYAAVREAAQQQALGNNELAAQLYEAVAASEVDRGERAGSFEKAIALRRSLGQSDTALALYERLLELADLPGYRARLLAEGAALAREVGQTDKSRVWLQEIVEKNLDTTQAADAVGLLQSDPAAQLSPATAARALFAAERYDAALPLFDAAIGVAAGDEALELRRLRALTLRGQQNLQGALDGLAAIVAEAPDSTPGRQAQLDWVQTTGWSGQVEQAIAGYRQFAERYNGDPLAAEALSRAAELIERGGDTLGAARQRIETAGRFPASELAQGELFGAGWTLYRANQPDAAKAAWDLLADNASASGPERARAAFWSAALAGDDQDQAVARWQQAHESAPEAYYGTRAADKLAELQIVLPDSKNPRSLNEALSAEDWRVAGQWAATTFGLPVSDTLRMIDQPPPEVAQAGQIVRGTMLEEVGLHVEAINEWNALRVIWDDDPLKLLMVARIAHEAGVPSVGLRAAAQLEALAPAGTELPDALLRLAYPAPYPDLVRRAAQEQGIDPLLLYALLRQESLFDAGAVSSVGALGLGQVMPDTGRGIAQRLGVQDFSTDLLLHPATSVRFAAFYIAQQIKAMDGSIHAGLSAYNGGPGNAQRWIEATGLDNPDLFTESIDFPETRSYVKSVYAHYDVYRRLYQQ